MSGQDGQTPEAVPARATRAGETSDRWSWVEPSVWTPRMLAALEQGVKDAFFAKQGLFSLRAAHAQARQSSCR
jgi:hypothetical protein